MENGIKPVYVFDGKPPELKLGELAARREKAANAKEKLAEAQKSGDSEAILKATKGTVRVSKEQNEQTKHLLRLMGVPFVAFKIASESPDFWASANFSFALAAFSRRAASSPSFNSGGLPSKT